LPGHLFQSSLRSRCAATPAGLRILIQTGQGPGPIAAGDLNASARQVGRRGGDGKPTPGVVFVEQNTGLGIAQYQHQRFSFRNSVGPVGSGRIALFKSRARQG
jgi:hypothetical protein